MIVDLSIYLYPYLINLLELQSTRKRSQIYQTRPANEDIQEQRTRASILSIQRRFGIFPEEQDIRREIRFSVNVEKIHLSISECISLIQPYQKNDDFDLIWSKLFLSYSLQGIYRNWFVDNWRSSGKLIGDTGYKRIRPTFSLTYALLCFSVLSSSGLKHIEECYPNHPSKQE